MSWLKKYYPYTLYILIVVGIMLPLYRSGFVFLLDMIFTPTIDLSEYMTSGVPAHFPIIVIIKALSYIIPIWVIQKIILSLLLFLPAAFMYRLARNYFERSWAFFAGLIYMLNPWTYERFLAGHWYVYLGYAFLPLFFHLSEQMVNTWSRRNFVKWLVLAALYSIINLHMAYIAFGLFAVYLLFVAFERKFVFDWKKVIKYSLVALIALVAVNSFWIVNYTRPQHDFEQITFDDFRAYPTASDERLGTHTNVIGLYGFWNHDYALPKDIFKYWWVPSLALVMLFIMGIIPAFKSRSKLIRMMIILFIPIFIVALGVSTSFSRPFVEFIYNYLPGFKGLRETSKLIGLMAFAYALVIPFGAIVVTRYIRTSLNHTALYRTTVGLIMLLPLFTVFSMANGFFRQVRSVDYPQSWYEADQKLPMDSKVLFLPWAAYVRFPFVDNHLIGNPADRFFSAEMVHGKNIENEELPDYKENEIDEHIHEMVEEQKINPEQIQFLREQGITHIMVVAAENSDEYKFLESETDQLQVYYQTEDLIIYEIKT